MKKKIHNSLVIIFLLIAIFPFQVFSQKVLGLMPIKMKVVKKNGNEVTVWETTNNPMWSSGESLEQYEKKYLPLVQKELRKQFNKKGFAVTRLELDSLTEQEKADELIFFNQIRSEIGYFILDQSKPLFKNKKKEKRDVGKAAPLSQKFGDKMGRKYLLYVSVMGHHIRHKRDEKQNAPYPEYAFGNMSIFGIKVHAKTGKIIDYIEVKMAEIPSFLSRDINYTPEKNIRITEKKIRNMVSKFLKELD